MLGCGSHRYRYSPAWKVTSKVCFPVAATSVAPSTPTPLRRKLYLGEVLDDERVRPRGLRPDRSSARRRQGDLVRLAVLRGPDRAASRRLHPGRRRTRRGRRTLGRADVASRVRSTTSDVLLGVQLTPGSVARVASVPSDARVVELHADERPSLERPGDVQMGVVDAGRLPRAPQRSTPERRTPGSRSHAQTGPTGGTLASRRRRSGRTRKEGPVRALMVPAWWPAAAVQRRPPSSAGVPIPPLTCQFALPRTNPDKA